MANDKQEHKRVSLAHAAEKSSSNHLLVQLDQGVHATPMGAHLALAVGLTVLGCPLG